MATKKAPAEIGKDGLAIRAFATRAAWLAWLGKTHATCPGLWLKLGKKSCPEPCIDYATALDGALIWGWIDSQKAAYDEHHFLQRFTPRTAKSPWSQVNVAKIAALLEAGVMQPPGLREVERAKADGRWDQAYAGARTSTVPDDLTAALAQNPKARKFFETIDRTNRYAILYRVQSAKKPETRARRIAQFVTMLENGERIHAPTTK